MYITIENAWLQYFGDEMKGPSFRLVRAQLNYVSGGLLREHHLQFLIKKSVLITLF